MITLGLDPSFTGYGWCVHDSSQVGPARIVARGRVSTPAKDVFVKRYKFLRQIVDDLLDKYPEVEGIGVESPTYGEFWSMGAYALFVYTNEAIYDRRKDVIYFDPLTLKALVKQDPKVRKGTMFKSDMVDAAKADTGIKGPLNHDEADAYHIARFAARFWELDRGLLQESDLTPSELLTFCRTHTYQRGKRAGETVKLGAIFRENDRFHRFSQVERDHDGSGERYGRQEQQEAGDSSPGSGRKGGGKASTRPTDGAAGRSKARGGSGNGKAGR
jgi:Holliday junction resolvasome RuvABC endonuclease subunit